MIRRHFLTALRSFLKHKSSFFINLIGLATGLLCTLLILMWVSDERSVDKFHQQSDRIFRVMEHQRYANGDVFTTRSTPGLLASNLKLEFPEVEYATTCSWQIPFMIGYGDRTFKERVCMPMLISSIFSASRW